MDEVEFRAELAMLRAQLKGQSRLIEALVLALARNKVIGLDHVIETLALAKEWVHATEGETVAIPLFAALGRLKGFNVPMDPHVLLAAHAILHADAAEDQRGALQEWLAQATPDELVQDLQDAFRRVGERLRRDEPPPED